MTEQQIKDTQAFLKERYEKELEMAESPLEKKMLEKEYSKNVELVKAGNNIFESNRPDDSDFECLNCGS